MGKFVVMIFILVAIVLALLATSNTGTTTISVPWPLNEVYTLSVISLIIISSALGAIAVALIMFVRDTKRMIVTYQFQKKRKREEKLRNLYTKAMNSMLADDNAEARKILEDILKDEPAHTEALMRLGAIAEKANNNDEAHKFYKKALMSAPGDLSALFAMASLSDKLGKWTDAIEYVDEILQRDQGNLGAKLMKRSILEHTANWDELVEVQKNIIKAEQKAGRDVGGEEEALSGYRYEQGKALLDSGQTERAIKVFKGIIKSDDHFVPAYLAKAEAMLKSGNSEDAVSFLENGYRNTLSSLILAKIEDLLIKAGDPSRLISIYRNAMASAPQNQMLRFFLGKLYYRLEMVDDALELLDTGEIPEDFPQWNQLLGELFLRRNNCERAIEEFKKTIDFKKTLRVPYCCSSCGHQEEQWAGRCPECGSWNTFEFKLHGTCKI